MEYIVNENHCAKTMNCQSLIQIILLVVRTGVAESQLLNLTWCSNLCICLPSHLLKQKVQITYKCNCLTHFSITKQSDVLTQSVYNTICWNKMQNIRNSWPRMTMWETMKQTPEDNKRSFQYLCMKSAWNQAFKKRRESPNHASHVGGAHEPS